MTDIEAAPEHVGRYTPECSCGYQGQGRDFDEARRDVERHQIEAHNASVAPAPTTEETT